MSLPTFLKQHRLKANLTQLQLATKLNYKSGQFISNWERGDSQPPIRDLKKLARHLKCDPSHLYNELMDIYSAKLLKGLS